MEFFMREKRRKSYKEGDGGHGRISQCDFATVSIVSFAMLGQALEIRHAALSCWLLTEEQKNVDREILPLSPNSPDLSPVSLSSSPTWKTPSAEAWTRKRFLSWVGKGILIKEKMRLLRPECNCWSSMIPSVYPHWDKTIFPVTTTLNF